MRPYAFPLDCGSHALSRACILDLRLSHLVTSAVELHSHSSRKHVCYHLPQDSGNLVFWTTNHPYYASGFDGFARARYRTDSSCDDLLPHLKVVSCSHDVALEICHDLGVLNLRNSVKSDVLFAVLSHTSHHHHIACVSRGYLHDHPGNAFFKYALGQCGVVMVGRMVAGEWFSHHLRLKYSRLTGCRAHQPPS